MYIYIYTYIYTYIEREREHHRIDCTSHSQDPSDSFLKMVHRATSWGLDKDALLFCVGPRLPKYVVSGLGRTGADVSMLRSLNP